MLLEKAALCTCMLRTFMVAMELLVPRFVKYIILNFFFNLVKGLGLQSHMGGLQAYMYFNSLVTDRFCLFSSLRTDRFTLFEKNH